MAESKWKVLVNNDIELVYVMDPHCGWCFGFGKVILDLFEIYKDNSLVNFDIKPGGLFYPAIEIEEGFADGKRPIAKRIEELAKVKFSENYFTKILGTGSILDSEPPARAILSIKKITRDILVQFTERLLEKEFIFGKNTSFDETIFECIKEFKVEEAAFEKHYNSAEMKQQVILEFQQARSMVTGFPVLFVKHKNQLTKLAGGYAPRERLVKKIEALLVE